MKFALLGYMAASVLLVLLVGVPMALLGMRKDRERERVEEEMREWRRRN